MNRSLSPSMNDINTLFETVVHNGYCIGCGACTAVDQSPISIELDEWGQFQAVLAKDHVAVDSATGSKTLAVCPFSDASTNEDILAKGLFPANARPHPAIGLYLGTFAGFVSEDEFRRRGSSGGMGKWITHELLRRSLVDAVVHVHQVESPEPGGLLYRYQVVHSLEEVKAGSKSVYYPVEMSGILKHIKENPGRYAVVGVPCFIKAIRLLASQEPIFKERVVYCIGLVCGHLKSTKYAEMIAWQRGIEPGELVSIDFRKKLSGATAKQKGVEVVGRRHGETMHSEGIVQEFFGTNYPHGFFMYNACNYCDDVTSETADLVIGDAWLPQYVADGNGTNVVIVRNANLLQIVEEGIATGALTMHPLSADDVASSQAGGLRQRREGLAYRLFLKDKARQWRPRKRVVAESNHLTPDRRIIYQQRMLLTKESHLHYQEAVSVKSYAFFERRMKHLIDAYSRIGSSPNPSNRSAFITRIAKRIFRRLRSWSIGKRFAVVSHQSAPSARSEARRP